MGKHVLVVCEHLRGSLDDVTFELLGKAVQLSDTVSAALIGGDAGMVDGLGKAGKVFHVDDASVADFNPESCSAALGAIVDASGAELVLVANTSMGMDLAASLAATKSMSLVAYAMDVALDGDTVVATSRLYGGKVYAESAIDGDKGIVSVLAGSFPADAGRGDGSPEVVSVAAPDTPGNVVFKGLIEPEGGDVDITTQDVLVAVGRGIQSEDNIAMTEELAAAMGGAVCSSRPIVDNKWLPKTRQVGKSGLKVKPKVYVMLGISGAPEHMEGMKDAELIIAVNTDETAPIFEHAHYGTTEDLFDLVPLLTERLK